MGGNLNIGPNGVKRSNGGYSGRLILIFSLFNDVENKTDHCDNSDVCA
jgi:hypothetical protein